MAYRIVAIPMTFSGIQGHAPVTGLLKWDFSYTCAAVDNVSTGVVRFLLLLLAALSTSSREKHSINNGGERN